MITFDIVDVPYAYNSILSWGTLNRFGVIPHHNYLCLRMPGPQGLISIHNNKDLARRIKYGHSAPLYGHHIHTVAQESFGDPPSAYLGHRGPPKP